MLLDTRNPEFQDALNLIQYTRQSVFLTGKAGTGKSTFLKYVCANTKKKHIVLAPTGIAAINVGGSTLHSFFKLPFYPLLPDDPNFSLKGGKAYYIFFSDNCQGGQEKVFFFLTICFAVCPALLCAFARSFRL